MRRTLLYVPILFQLSFKTALLLERYEKRGLAGGEISEDAARRRPTFGKTEDAAFRQVTNSNVPVYFQRS